MQIQFKTIKHIILILVFNLLAAIVTNAQDDVTVPVGDIPPGQQITITYDATVRDPLPEGLLFIENQGLVTGSNFDAIYSDDPDTTINGDETLTLVGFTLNVSELPGTGESPWIYNMIISFVMASLAGIVVLLVTRHRIHTV